MGPSLTAKLEPSPAMYADMGYAKMNDQGNWDDIKIFVAVAEHRSLSQAAKQLNLSQPTVGRRIQALEMALGFSLFTRSPTGYELTESAQHLLPLADQLGSTARQFYLQAQSQKPVTSGRVRIACGETFGRFLTRHAREMSQRHPEISLDIISGFNFVNLEKGEADIAIRNVRPDNPNLFVRQLGQSAYAIYGSQDYVNGDQHALTEQRYHYSRWTTFDGQQGTPPSYIWLKQRVKDAQIGLRCSSSSLLLQAVQQGYGLAPLPCSLAAESPDLVRLTPILEDLQNTLWLVSQRDAHRIPRIQLVARWISDLFELNRTLFAPNQ
ncbi:MAG: hypothetical protein CMK89_22190 [Pseudomonadales bacterium]|nr:hypothetical protein [Pseudomonadales bacterium]